MHHKQSYIWNKRTQWKKIRLGIRRKYKSGRRSSKPVGLSIARSVTAAKDRPLFFSSRGTTEERCHSQWRWHLLKNKEGILARCEGTWNPNTGKSEAGRWGTPEQTGLHYETLSPKERKGGMEGAREMREGEGGGEKKRGKEGRRDGGMREKREGGVGGKWARQKEVSPSHRESHGRMKSQHTQSVWESSSIQQHDPACWLMPSINFNVSTRI